MRKLFIYLVLVVSSFVAPIKPVAAETAVPKFEAVSCPFEFPADLDVTCGELTVPENRIQPTGNRITLPFVVIHSPSLNPRPDPIIYTSSGGPGLGAFGAWRHLAYNFDFLATRDIILLEQRGTRWSEPYLNCPDLNMVMFENLTRILPREDEIAHEVQAALACRDELLAQGIDLNAYNTLETVADLEDLRTTLGIEQWNFVGSSYAARIGLTLARLHPESLQSMVLDSVYDPSVNFIEARVPSFASVLEQLFAACAEDVDCSKTYPKLEEHFYEVIARANENPIAVNIDHPRSGESVTVYLTGDDLVLGVFNALRDARLIGYLPFVIEEIHAGNMSVIIPLAQNGFASMFNTPLGVYYAVECAEEYPYNDMEHQQSVAQGYAGLENFLPTPADASICAAWNAEPVNASFREPTVSDVPALILSGEYDAVTPAAFSQQTASRLGNAVYINTPGLGHAVMDVDACARQMASTFIESPESFSSTICQPGNEALEFITEKDVVTTSVVYFTATKIHSAAVIVIPAMAATLSLIGLVIGLRKRVNALFIAAAAFLSIFFAGMVWVLLTADPVLLGFGVPSTLGWVALLSAAGSFVFSVVVTKRHASTTGNRTVEEDN
jgi:pimeloyl-ACP methyl ester carboxylesterase